MDGFHKLILKKKQVTFCPANFLLTAGYIFSVELRLHCNLLAEFPKQTSQGFPPPRNDFFVCHLFWKSAFKELAGFSMVSWLVEIDFQVCNIGQINGTNSYYT